MTRNETPDQRRARARAERERLARTKAERAELREAGERRRAAMVELGAKTYRSLLARLNGGSELIERRP